MRGILAWVDSNWFSILQSIGIVGGLIFTGKTIRDAARTQRDATEERKVSNILEFDARHQNIWSDLYQREDLRRILEEQNDFLKGVVTPVEFQYLRQKVVQFQVGWELAKISKPEEIDAVVRDAAKFFSRPLSRRVWNKVKGLGNPKFVELVDEAMMRPFEKP